MCLNNYQIITHHKFLVELTEKSFRSLMNRKSWYQFFIKDELSLSLGFHKIFTDLKRFDSKSLDSIDYHYFLVGNLVF